MWYFLIRQSELEISQYQQLQKLASLTEVELFNEPYRNWYIFSVEKATYLTFMNELDKQGIPYDLNADRPTRSELLATMR